MPNSSFVKPKIPAAGLLCALVAILVVVASGPAQAARVRADGYRILLNGDPFVVKGMNYSPVPIGVDPSQSPYGDYFVRKYDNVWKPDIDDMRAAGVNVVKLYAGDPGANAGQPGTAGDWKPFLDYCYNDGVNPIYVLMMSYTQGGVIAAGGSQLDGYINDYTKMVRSTVTHPALFGYLVGNEIVTNDLANNPTFWVNFGKLVDRAFAAGVTQGRNPFITTAIVDNYTPEAAWPAVLKGEQSGELKRLDAWGINVYRGPEFGGSGNSPFVQYRGVMETLGEVKPLLITEWGTPHTTRTAQFYGQNVTTPIQNLDDVPDSQMGTGQPYFAAIPVAGFLTSVWAAIEANVGAGADQVCAGGFVFGWCDEYWKGNNRNQQIGGPEVNFQGGAFAGGYADEAGYGVTGAVQNIFYGPLKPKIKRDVFKGYGAVKAFYSSSSASAAELYNLSP